jgi:hypothetical protein
MGQTPEDKPRFCLCLVVGSESVEALAGLPAELPPLRCAVNVEEKREFLGIGHGGWLCLLETDYMGEPDLSEDLYRGWLRVNVADLEHAWFSRLTRHKLIAFSTRGGRTYWEYPTGAYMAPAHPPMGVSPGEPRRF